MNIGIIGCGTISTIYCENSRRFDHYDILKCADSNRSASERLCSTTGVGVAATVEELLEDQTIELVVNLTPPLAHAAISKRILEHGKHLYSEKPLALSLKEAQELSALASETGLSIGCAPDTFLGGGIQKARELLAMGAIGSIHHVSAAMTTPGHEAWHPNPDFYYTTGGGPLWDMGPYYLSALMACFGAIESVEAIASPNTIDRIIATGNRAGELLEVSIPTTIHTLLRFTQGMTATMLMSFDITQTHLPHIEVYGTEGTLTLPDPNFFGGSLQLYTKERPQWVSIPAEGDYINNDRGLGIERMCQHLEDGGGYVNNGQWATHIVDCIETIFRSTAEQRRCHLTTSIVG